MQDYEENKLYLIKRSKMDPYESANFLQIFGVRNILYFIIWMALSVVIFFQLGMWINKKNPAPNRDDYSDEDYLEWKKLNDRKNKLDRILGPIILIASPVLSYFALRFLRWILL